MKIHLELNWVSFTEGCSCSIVFGPFTRIRSIGEHQTACQFFVRRLKCVKLRPSTIRTCRNKPIKRTHLVKWITLQLDTDTWEHKARVEKFLFKLSALWHPTDSHVFLMQFFTWETHLNNSLCCHYLACTISTAADSHSLPGWAKKKISAFVSELLFHKHGFPISSQAADMFSMGLTQTSGQSLMQYTGQSCKGRRYFTVGQCEPDSQHQASDPTESVPEIPHEVREAA